jgi:hypothetical protein
MQMKLRLPADLKEFLSGMAKLNRRSLNNEVLLRLEASRQREGKAQKAKA